MSKLNFTIFKNPATRFAITFLVLFALFYVGYLANLSYSTPGGAYSPFVETYLNMVHWLRWLLLHATQLVLNVLGYTVVINEHNLLVAGHNMIILNYDCLGFGVMCFFAAFVLAFPKPWKQKLVFLLLGLIGIQLVNIVRLGWLALHWRRPTSFLTDQHNIFNIVIYILISVALIFWIKSGKRPSANVKNRSV